MTPLLCTQLKAPHSRIACFLQRPLKAPSFAYLQHGWNVGGGDQDRLPPSTTPIFKPQEALTMSGWGARPSSVPTPAKNHPGSDVRQEAAGRRKVESRKIDSESSESPLRIATNQHLKLLLLRRNLGIARFESHGYESPSCQFRIADSMPLRVGSAFRGIKLSQVKLRHPYRHCSTFALQLCEATDTTIGNKIVSKLIKKATL